MILAFYLAPGHREDGRWVLSGAYEDEQELGPLPDGTYAIYEYSKAAVKGGPDALNSLPSTLRFLGFRESGTEPPKYKVKKVKK